MKVYEEIRGGTCNMQACELFKFKNWVVIGDVLNCEKYAYRILCALKADNFNTVGVHHKGGEGVYTSLKDVPYKIDVIDLCINPVKGIQFMREAKELKIDKVLIQPGAGSLEIRSFCKDNDIMAIEGCVLVELADF
jgi:predicted CoA-binding protein